MADRAVVLVVDDEADVRETVRRGLERAGFAVVTADRGDVVPELMARHRPDLVLLDIGLPGRDGFDVLRELRQGSAVPVILLSGRVDEIDRVLGFELGADDYVTKPYSARELALRAKAVLRRPARTGDRAAHAGRIVHGDLEIDPGSREVRVAGRPVVLTAREFDLLLFLARSPNRAWTRRQLLAEVWNVDSPWQDPDTVTEHVRRLRRKIEVDPDAPARIVTLRGVGYKFRGEGPGARPPRPAP